MAALDFSKHYTVEFETNWNRKAQELDDMLRQYVTLESFTGEAKRINLINPDADPQEILELAGATQHSDIGSEVRWIQTKAWDLAHIIDEWNEELLGEVSSPNSVVMQEMFSSFERNCTRRIIDAATATVIGGKDRDLTYNYDTNQDVAVNYVESGSAADSNLTIGKLRKVKDKFGKNKVSGQNMSINKEPIIMAISQSQVTSLLRTTEVTSQDYNTVKALVNGETDSFMGIKFVVTEELDIDSSNVRTCLAWVKSGIRFMEGGHRVDIERLGTRKYGTQIYVRNRNGGVRTEEVKVMRIYCDEDL